MTNTINNVPRELLEEVMLAAQRMPVRGPSIRAKLHALLSAPSPAGVDGLEVRAYEDSGGALYTAKLLEIMEVDSVGCEPLCRLSDAKAIIDGLRGENERIRLNIAEYNEAISCYQSERDQQAQRIGELEGLLDRVKVSLSLDETEWGYSAPEKYKLLADIRAALSAGKEWE